MRLWLCLAVFLVACGSDESRSPIADAGMDAAPDSHVAPDAPDMDDGVEPIPDGCNPVAWEHDCVFPYPSDVFLENGAVGLTGEAQFKVRDQPVDFFAASPTDGFSVHPGIVARIRGGFDDTGLIFHDGDIDATLAPGSTTVLLDAASGQPIPHFAEAFKGNQDPNLSYLGIRPLVRLEPSHRYIVAIQTLRSKQGDELHPPAGFGAIKAGSQVRHPALRALQTRYDADIFEPLEAFGVAREELYLAWDFTVRSETDLTADVLSVRTQTLAHLDANGPNLKVSSVHTGDEIPPAARPYLSRVVRGTITVPLFVSTPDAGATLTRDASARPVAAATAEVPFVATIPNSVMDQADTAGPARVIQFGHGIFGERDEIVSEVQAEFADQKRFVLVAVDWWGMSRADRDVVVANIVQAPDAIYSFTQRLVQAMANQLVLTRAIRTALDAQDAFRVDNLPLVDRDSVFFMGISMGHILGGVYAALASDISRFVLHVGGGSFGFIQTRSEAFQALEIILRGVFGPEQGQRLTAVSSTFFDAIDPIAWAPFVRAAPLAGSPAKDVLMHAGVGDVAVPNLATHLHARALGLPLLEPAVREIYGLQPVATATSAFMEVDFGIGDPTRYWMAPEAANPVHDSTRRVPAVRDQIDAFMRNDGQVVQPCGGPCTASP